MDDGIWLSPRRVAELTGLKANSWKAQAKRLRRMGTPFTLNAVGRPLVCRSLFDIEQAANSKTRPNWSRQNGSQKKT